MRTIKRCAGITLQTLLILSTLTWIDTFADSAIKRGNADTTSKAIDGATALEMLKKGNERFISGNLRTDGESKNDIERLSKSQSPRAVVLSCSDSRVPPELIFDQKLGEIFTVRAAGEALSQTAIASIEYAIEKLGSRLIVVLGHTNCGAVKAAIDTLDGKSAGSENLDQLVFDIHPRIRPAIKKESLSTDLRDESLANARGVAKDLSLRSKLIANAIESKKVKIVTGLYDLTNGKVEFQ